MSKGVKRDGGMLLDSGVYNTICNICWSTARGIEKPCNKIDGISLDVQSHDDDEEKGEKRRITFGHHNPLLSSLAIKD